jgi:anti-sigma factor RsiW
MECKKAQERLITEYLDKEMDAGDREGIKQHLADCADCREFLRAVQKAAVLPFKEAGEIQPDPAVWQKIQEKIEAERERSEGGFWRLVDRLVSRLPLPVPLMRAAFVTALILVVVVLAKWPASYADPVYGYLSEQMTFMGELGAGNTDLMNGDLQEYDAVLKEISD